MSRSEIHEVGHRIYTVGRSRQLGISGFELRDQNQTVVERGSYIECMNALHNLKLTAARRAWMGSSTVTPIDHTIRLLNDQRTTETCHVERE